MKSTHSKIKLNIKAFAIIGIAYFLYSFIIDTSSLKANPLYFLGVDGIYISIIGGVIAYYLYFYYSFPILNIAFFSFALYFLWFLALVLIGPYLKDNLSNTLIALIFIGFLTFLYYAFLGALNGIFGYYITLFNLFVIANAILNHEAVSPIVWTNILGVIGTNDPTMQWIVVAVSTILGISDKGYDFFVNL